MNEKQYQTFEEFYPFYLTQHARPINRWMHFVGTALVISIFIYFLCTLNFLLLIALPLCGYGFAWIGHFILEKNRPATFTYPLFSLRADFVMFYHILMGKIEEKVAEAHQKLGIQNPWK